MVIEGEPHVKKVLGDRKVVSSTQASSDIVISIISPLSPFSPSIETTSSVGGALKNDLSWREHRTKSYASSWVIGNWPRGFNSPILIYAPCSSSSSSSSSFPSCFSTRSLGKQTSLKCQHASFH